MNVQESLGVSNPPSSSAPNSSPANNVQRLMPVLYVNPSNMKAVTSATHTPSPGPSPALSTTSTPTILTAMPQIQIAGGGGPQIIHSAQNPNSYSYVPVRHVYQQAKTAKDPPKKVFVTSINSGHNNKSNQVNLILPNSQSSNTGNKSPITSLILPSMGSMPNKSTITGIMVPNNSSTAPSKQTVASLLLPANAKYPNIAPNKKVPIPNIIVPPQGIQNKTSNVPNIIRQSNNTSGKNVVGIFSSPSNSSNQQMTSLLLTPNINAGSKQTPTSMGLIPHPHGLLVSQSPGTSAGVTSQSLLGQPTHHSIIVQQPSGQSQSIIVPQSTSCQPQSQPQLTNLIITSTSTGSPHTPNTPVASLLISNNPSATSSVGTGPMTSLLVSSCGTTGANYCSVVTTPAPTPAPVTMTVGNSAQAPALTPPPHPHATATGKNIVDTNISICMRENKQSVLVKSVGEATYPSLPPLQPISSKDGGKSLSLLNKAPNGITVPESLVMTPVNSSDSLKTKLEQMSDDMIIERTSIIRMDEKGTSTNVNLKADETHGKVNENNNKTDMKSAVAATPATRETERDEGVVLDGEVTVRRLGPDKEDAPEKKHVEDDVELVKIEVVKPDKQKQPPATARYQKPEDLNPMEVLEWDHQGVGKLPGSNIKFRINEFGLELVDSNKDESASNTPNSSRRNSDDKPPNSEIKPKGLLEGGDKDKIYCCEGCGCYGLYTEFLTDTRFCSVGCKKIVLARNEFKKKRHEDKLKELKLRRKRRKIKLLQQRAKKGSVDQKNEKDIGKPKAEPLDEAEMISKAWANRMAELRKGKKVEGSIKINMQPGDVESPNDSSLLTSSANSDSEASEVASRSPHASVLSEDDASSGKTGPMSDTGKESWVNSAGEFVWPVYLQKCCNKAKAAPIRLFKDPFPYGKNGFKVGMKLEGIDPEHQAIISVLTVAQVKGHRTRVHFDGYPDQHDFWVNSDSPDIFPPGWCEKNSHTLHPPRGYTADNFSWNVYLKQCRAQPAPKSLFPKSNAPLCPSQFRVGMKLEAVDRKNSSLICVASVSDLIDNRLLIHFDSWGDVYDYWTDPSSPYIHPVGWCEENGHDLTPPNTFKNPNLFSWDAYLKESKSQAAPARAFKPRPPNAFKRGMKLEAIDKRTPHLLRPATVREVKDYQIKITFDGYPEEFGYWVDDDCPDIHPTGWGQKTGHPVTPPPLSSVKSECGTVGCTGDGNIKGGYLTKHTAPAFCPYSAQNLNRESGPDRFCVNPDFYEVPEPISRAKPASVKQEIKQEAAEDSSCSESRIKTRHSSSTTLKEETKAEPTIKTEPEEKTEERVERRGRKRKLPEAEHRVEQLDKLRRELIESVYRPSGSGGGKTGEVEVGSEEAWARNVTPLSHKVNVTGGDPRCWSHKQVAAFVNTVIPSRAKLFLDQEVDGDSFLMLTQSDLTKVLGLKLGPALKIYNCIILLRKKVMTL